MQEHTCTVLAIDDHPLFRKGLADLIAMEHSLSLVAEAADGATGFELACQLQPDLIMLDLNMKGVDGMETLKLLKDADVDSRVIMLTVSDAEQDVVSALRAGADGYLLKDMEPEDTLHYLRQASQGRMVISERLTGLLAHALRNEQKAPENLRAAGLTEREEQILQLIAQGLSNKLIGRRLEISEGTVKVHVKHLLKKLNLHSRVEAAVWVVNNAQKE